MKKELHISKEVDGLTFDIYDTSINVQEVIESKNLSIEWDEVNEELGLTGNEKGFVFTEKLINYIEEETLHGIYHLLTDEGYILVKLVECPEEWYEVMSNKLNEEGIRHKTAGTGTIYIQMGDNKVRIADHNANGKIDIDVDSDKVEEDFDTFCDAIRSGDFDELNDFLY